MARLAHEQSARIVTPEDPEPTRPIAWSYKLFVDSPIENWTDCRAGVEDLGAQQIELFPYNS